MDALDSPASQDDFYYVDDDLNEFFGLKSKQPAGQVASSPPVQNRAAPPADDGAHKQCSSSAPDLSQTQDGTTIKSAIPDPKCSKSLTTPPGRDSLPTNTSVLDTAYTDEDGYLMIEPNSYCDADPGSPSFPYIEAIPFNDLSVPQKEQLVVTYLRQDFRRLINIFTRTSKIHSIIHHFMDEIGDYFYRHRNKGGLDTILQKHPDLLVLQADRTLGNEAALLSKLVDKHGKDPSTSGAMNTLAQPLGLGRALDNIDANGNTLYQHLANNRHIVAKFIREHNRMDMLTSFFVNYPGVAERVLNEDPTILSTYLSENPTALHTYLNTNPSIVQNHLSAQPGLLIDIVRSHPDLLAKVRDELSVPAAATSSLKNTSGSVRGVNITSDSDTPTKPRVASNSLEQLAIVSEARLQNFQHDIYPNSLNGGEECEGTDPFANYDLEFLTEEDIDDGEIDEDEKDTEKEDNKNEEDPHEEEKDDDDDIKEEDINETEDEDDYDEHFPTHISGQRPRPRHGLSAMACYKNDYDDDDEDGEWEDWRNCDDAKHESKDSDGESDYDSKPAKPVKKMRRVKSVSAAIDAKVARTGNDHVETTTFVPYPASEEAKTADEQKPRGSREWTLRQEDCGIKHMLAVRDEGQIKGEARFAESARRMNGELGGNRTAISFKNFWNRSGRQRSGFDERRCKNNPLATSLQGKLAMAKKALRKKGKKDRRGKGRDKGKGRAKETETETEKETEQASNRALQTTERAAASPASPTRRISKRKSEDEDSDDD